MIEIFKKYISLLTRHGDEECPVCQGNLRTPVKLPCGHYVCDQTGETSCLETIKEHQSSKCPECSQAFAEDFKPDESTRYVVVVLVVVVVVAASGCCLVVLALVMLTVFIGGTAELAVAVVLLLLAVVLVMVLLAVLR